MLHGHVGEEVGHALAVVRAADGLGQDHTHVYALEGEIVRDQTTCTVVHLNLGAVAHVLLLRDRVGHDQRFQSRLRDPLTGRAREDPVRQDRVHLGGARLAQLLRRVTDSPARVRHVVHQNRHAVPHFAHEHHGGHLVGLLALFVDQREVHVQAVRYGSDALRTARVRTHYRGVRRCR